MNGIIIKGVGGLYSVYSEGKIYSCKARGVFRKNGLKPMIGDKAVLSDIDEAGLNAVIDDICDRRNELVRPAVANVDRVVFVVSAGHPEPDFLLIDRLLTAARQKNLETALVVNKSDEDRENAEKILETYKNAVDFEIGVSAEDGTGVEELKKKLSSGVSVLAGQSGVGKSSITNKIAGIAEAETGELTRKLERGKHTTRHNEIFPAGGGFVIDSPGFSMYDVSIDEPLELQQYYPELRGISGCRFADCSHTGEKGCAAHELLEKGLISPERYERYKVIYKEISDNKKNRYR